MREIYLIRHGMPDFPGGARMCLGRTDLPLGLRGRLQAALLGASGVVFMMIVLSSFTEMKKGGIPITLILVVVFYLGGELVDGLKNTDNISQLTHIVGGVCGMVFGFTLRSRKR